MQVVARLTSIPMANLLKARPRSPTSGDNCKEKNLYPRFSPLLPLNDPNPGSRWRL